jgi:hypothetical protein
MGHYTASRFRPAGILLYLLVVYPVVDRAQYSGLGAESGYLADGGDAGNAYVFAQLSYLDSAFHGHIFRAHSIPIIDSFPDRNSDLYSNGTGCHCYRYARANQYDCSHPGAADRDSHQRGSGRDREPG